MDAVENGQPIFYEIQKNKIDGSFSGNHISTVKMLVEDRIIRIIRRQNNFSIASFSWEIFKKEKSRSFIFKSAKRFAKQSKTQLVAIVCCHWVSM